MHFLSYNPVDYLTLTGDVIISRSFKRPTEELAHLAWCALIALKLARREGITGSSLKEHIFFMQWLATAQKKKLFPKTLADDIIWLQDQGKRYGPAARLSSKIEYIWLVSSGELLEQSTLFRFTYMVDTLRTMGWQDYLLSNKDWNNGWKSGGDVPAVYTPKDKLHASFTPTGKLLLPLELRFTGDIRGIYQLLEQCGLTTQTCSDKQGYTVLCLNPE